LCQPETTCVELAKGRGRIFQLNSYINCDTQTQVESTPTFRFRIRCFCNDVLGLYNNIAPDRTADDRKREAWESLITAHPAASVFKYYRYLRHIVIRCLPRVHCILYYSFWFTKERYRRKQSVRESVYRTVASISLQLRSLCLVPCAVGPNLA